MIDDELLQDLLAKASGLYNSGDYRGAIAAWKEALGVDPSSQKAREGIQMATLLLADWEPSAAVADLAAPDAPEPADPAPADGATASTAGLTPAEIHARIDQGVGRVRTLLRQRRYAEAIEGARGLVPIDPDSDEVQRLVEDAQQAFEAAPFIDEHLMLARELAAQDRMDEAETECKKVFALDPTNPDGHVLLMEIRGRLANGALGRQGSDVPETPAAPEAGDPGGRTVRIDASQLGALRASPKAQPEAEPEAETEAQDPSASAATAPTAESLPDDLFDFEPLGAPPASTALQAGALPVSEVHEGEPAIGEETVDGAPADEPPTTEAAPEKDSAADAPDEPPAEAPPEAEYVDAVTVVPPSTRLVDRTGAPGDQVGRILEAPEESDPIAIAKPASPAPAARPAPDAADPGGWEKELESLNLKTGQHAILGRSAARSSTPVGDPEGEIDLSSLFGDDLAGAPGTPGPVAGPATAGPAEPHANPAPLPGEASPGAPEHDRETLAAKADPEDALADEPPVERERPIPSAPPADPRARAAIPMYFALLGVVILTVAGGVWWFFLQPRAANGAVPPSSVPPPPAAARARVAGADGTIPTPLGSTSRQAAQPQRPAAKGAAGVPPAPPVAPPAAPQGAAAQPAAGADVAGDRNVVPPVGAAPRSLPSVAPPAGAAPQAAPPTAPATPAPVKPSSPEEIQREAARHLAEGKRLMSRGEWEPARGEFAAVLALDPMSLESKELLDQMQSKVDQDGRVRKDLDEARRAFEDKDYQGALWKLYRLPADPRLGNNELRIRNAWFNWAIVGLKGGDAVDAKQKLTEVLQADPDDAAAKKLMEVAERYAARAKDRYFYSVVDTLRFRTFDQK